MDDFLGMKVLEAVKGLSHHKRGVFLVGAWLFSDEFQHVFCLNPMKNM
jgi:hypothetical protein